MKKSSIQCRPIAFFENSISISVGYGKLLASMLLAHGAVLLFMWFFGYELTRFQSLLSVSGAALTGLLVLSGTYVGKAFGRKAVYILCFAFVLKVCVGVWHYLHFLDSDYFINTSAFTYLWDYEWMSQTMQSAADFWRDEGLSPLPASFYLGNKNPFLLAYNGILYFLSGNNHLNIAPWNALHSLYVAILVGALALQAGATKSQARFALTLAAYQPFGFISSIMWRDSVGQFWLIFGAYLLISMRDKKYLWLMILPFSCFFAWSVRQPYLFVMLALAAYIVTTSYKSQMKGWLIIICFAVIAVSFNFLPTLLDLGLDRFQETQQLDFSQLTFPLRLVRAFVGPFPWYQVFMGVEGTAYMPADFLQVVYNLTLVILVLPIVGKMWKESNRLDPGLFLSVLLFIAAAQAIGVHMSYVSIGMVLLLPLVCKVSLARWYKVFMVCFCGFFIANMAYWVVGLAGIGIVQSITGY